MKRVITIQDGIQYHFQWQRYYATSSFSSWNGIPFETKRLIPDTLLVDQAGEIIMEINNQGFKGADFDSVEPLAFVWGDSCVFGAKRRSWVDYIRLDPPIRTVNGGVEGQHILAVRDAVRDATQRFGPRIRGQLFYGSWHPLYRPFDARLWTSVYTEIAKCGIPTVFVSIPSPILSLAYDEYAALMPQKDEGTAWVIGSPAGSASGPARFRAFLGNCPFDPKQYKSLQEKLMLLNDLIREVCEEHRKPFYDLASSYRPENPQDFPRYFFDAAHPEPELYPLLAQLATKAMALLDKEGHTP